MGSLSCELLLACMVSLQLREAACMVRLSCVAACMVCLSCEWLHAW